MRLVVLPGVFRPPSDTWLLAAHLRAELAPGMRVLDVCTGSGALAVAAALGGCEVAAVDVSRLAVFNARLNARLNGVRVDARRGDLMAPVAGERFDLIVSNPPYVPSGSRPLPARGLARAWEGGFDGRTLLDRICAEAPAHLRPGGRLIMVQSSWCGEEATLARLRAAGLRPAVVSRRRGPLGPLLSARAAELESLGIVERGVREEELVVVRGSA
jgi:release factor glutamine methyltransferase